MSKKSRKNDCINFDASNISADIETSLFVLNGLRTEYPKQYANATGVTLQKAYQIVTGQQNTGGNK